VERNCVLDELKKQIIKEVMKNTSRESMLNGHKRCRILYFSKVMEENT
jgi:hypothetical protein